jgi:hypothetical protein
MIYGQPNFAVQPYAAPRPPFQAAPMPVQPAPRQPTQWQAPPQPIPATVRGVSQETPPAPKFVLPRPESLGIAKNLNVTPALAPQVDWNQIQARMERLGVLTYNKTRLPTGVVRVTMTLPGAAAPVEAQGATEAAAILLGLQQAEMRR